MNRSIAANQSPLVYDAYWSYPLVVVVLQFARSSFVQCIPFHWLDSLSHKQILDNLDLGIHKVDFYNTMSLVFEISTFRNA